VPFQAILNNNSLFLITLSFDDDDDDDNNNNNNNNNTIISLREEHMLKVSQHRVMRRIFGPKKLS